MVKQALKKSILRRKRSVRVRKSLRGSGDQPRLCVVRSNRTIEVQVIDDEKRITLVGASSGKGKKDAAALGAKIGELAKAKGVEKVIFDRGPFKYHGAVAALADSAREAGLKF